MDFDIPEELRLLAKTVREFVEERLRPLEMQIEDQDRIPDDVMREMGKLADKKRRPPLYGVAHYESCKLVFQPLTALGKDGPEYLTISPDNISQAQLVKAMKFT